MRSTNRPVYVAEPSHGRVWRLPVPPLPTRSNHPAVAVDNQGSVYVADGGSHSVLKLPVQ